MKNSIKVTELKEFKNLQPDSILITYSDHYRGNGGDNVYLLDAMAQDTNKFVNQMKWHSSMDDRGVISAYNLTGNNGAFGLFRDFKLICASYVNASKDLKRFENGDLVNSISDDSEYSKYGKLNIMYSKQKFEETKWFKNYSSRSLQSTIDKKRKKFYNNQEKSNAYGIKAYQKAKEDAANWFLENNISVRVAYLFNDGYFM
jgi:hypothetical protein